MFKTIRISENRYNDHYSIGSVFENSLTIKMTDDLFQKKIESVTNDKISSAIFRRSFMDSNLNLVAIEVASPIIENIDTFLNIITEVTKPEYEIKKGQQFNLSDYLDKLTITVNDSDKEYEISKSSELGKILMELTGLDFMIKKSNQDIIDSISI